MKRLKELFLQLIDLVLRSVSIFTDNNLFSGTYDIPVKGTDGAWLEGSEEIYDFIICVLAPLAGEYEMGETQFGFLYPAFAGRSGNPNRIYVYHANPKEPEQELLSVKL